MSENLETLSFLLHAPPKIGKSTLASTAPLPILVLDAEGGWKFIRGAGFQGRPLRKIAWDPIEGPAPRRYDDDGTPTWDVCVVTVRDWNTLIKTYQWLTQAEHDFHSIILDSVTEMQRRLKANLRGLEQMRIQDWGDLLVRMDSLIRSYRDLTLVGGIKCAIFVAETKQDNNGKWGPSMQGAIATSLPYWVDLVGYLYVQQETDDNGQPTVKVRKLLVAPHEKFVTGERVQGVLGDVVTEPDITEMYNRIFTTKEIQESLTEEITQ